MIKLCVVLGILIAPGAVVAPWQNVFEKKTFNKDGQTLLYRILYPKSYNKAKQYPVLTFLHGSGERGSDNESQLIHGGKLFMNDSVRNEFNAIVIFPQCPKDSTWEYHRTIRDTTSVTGRTVDFSLSSGPTIPALLVKQLLDSLITAKIADPKKMYIGGLSALMTMVG
jgi:predicted peptidase